MISAEVICDSISEEGKRLTTYKLRYPKFIHGEAKTHRVLYLGNEGAYITLEQEVGFNDDQSISRNASSSRAIPVPKSIEEIRSLNYASPVYWGREQKGMQAGEAFVGADLKHIIWLWREAALSAADHAERMHLFGAHKSLVNRILEPYLHINVVATATEWDNFFGLRLHKDAQPEMRVLAIAMWEARKASTPRLLGLGEWHLPFVWKDGGNEQILDGLLPPGNEEALTPLAQMIRISVARCARVSYESFETGKPSIIREDLKLYDRLLGAQPLHASPAEHQATPDVQVQVSGIGMIWKHNFLDRNEHGNFVGWRQYRQLLPGQACAPIPEEFR
jgi:hypothetical protein